jgi:hypothetical protein
MELILAPYLFYGIEVETRYADFPDVRDRGIMTGLRRVGDAVCVDVQVAADAKMHLLPHECLPVLRPLEHVAEPLAEDKIPGIEVAKIVWGQPLAEGYREPVSHARYPKINWKKVEISFCSSGCYDVYQKVADEELPGRERTDVLLSFYRDGRIQCPNGIPIPPAAFEYLRSLHFALDTPPHQFISY